MATTYTAYSVYYYDYNQEPAVGYGMAGGFETMAAL